MSWLITPSFSFDPDAAAYIAAVEGPSGDNQALETNTRYAINNFVIGCKQDGIWTAIKASCILAGARTLAGALVPLKGSAPTPFNFVSGDYDRKTGLTGNGSTEYLNSNRSGNADPQDNTHLAAKIEAAGSSSRRYLGATNATWGKQIYRVSSAFSGQINAAGPANFSVGVPRPCLFGLSRSGSTTTSVYAEGSTQSISSASVAPGSENLFVFANNASGTAADFQTARLSFYSIGESLNLALLDARVTDLINAFAAAIP